MSKPTLDIAALAKVELHCHLGGVLDPEMLGELRASGHDLGMQPEQLAATYPIRCMDDLLAYFATIDRYLKPKDERLALLLVQQVKRWRRQNVRYAEVFVSDLLGAREAIDDLVQLYGDLGRIAGEAAGGELQVELVSCISRSREDRMGRQAERIVALYEAGVICGAARCACQPPTTGEWRMGGWLEEAGVRCEIDGAG